MMLLLLFCAGLKLVSPANMDTLEVENGMQLVLARASNSQMLKEPVAVQCTMKSLHFNAQCQPQEDSDAGNNEIIFLVQLPECTFSELVASALQRPQTLGIIVDYSAPQPTNALQNKPLWQANNAETFFQRNTNQKATLQTHFAFAQQAQTFKFVAQESQSANLFPLFQLGFIVISALFTLSFLISLLLHFRSINNRRSGQRNSTNAANTSNATSTPTSTNATITANKPDTLDKSTIDAFPLALFQKGPPSECNETCPICIDEYRDGESVKVLPCGHVYHPLCIEPWFLCKSTACPLCKADVRELLAEQQKEGEVGKRQRNGGIFGFLGGVFAPSGAASGKRNRRSDEIVNV